MTVIWVAKFLVFPFSCLMKTLLLDGFSRISSLLSMGGDIFPETGGARLQELERDVDYLLFEDEGHGFTKASNMHKAMRASAYWLFKHLQ
jgi:hypothetical protein